MKICNFSLHKWRQPLLSFLAVRVNQLLTPIVVLLVMTGCHTTGPSDFDLKFLTDHAINVNGRGSPEVILKNRLVSARLRRPGLFTSGASMNRASLDYDKYLSIFRNDINQLIDDVLLTAPVHNGKRQILLYAHGGLNTESSRLGRIQELIGTGLPGSTNHITNQYPIFINWESGLLSSYGEHLTSLRQGRKYSRFSIQGFGAVPFVLIADLGRGIASSPSVWFTQLGTDFKGYGRSHSTWRNADKMAAEWQRTGEIDLTRHTNNPSGIDTAYRLGVHGLTLPTKLAAAPLIDGLGESAWQTMRRRTDTMFRPVYEFDLEYGRHFADPNQVGAATHSEPTGAMAIFLEQLEKRLKPDEYEITLVGHSMGAMVCNQILRRYPELPYKRILYMAAACRIRDLETSVIPTLKLHNDLIFQSWSLSMRAEAAERNLVESFDLAPRGSLLEWIDNFLDSPEGFQDRTLGKWENIAQAAHIFPEQVRSRVFLEEFGYRTKDDPQTHTEFGQQKFWAEPLKEELKTPVREIERRGAVHREEIRSLMNTNSK